jgi:hypothetical protein
MISYNIFIFDAKTVECKKLEGLAVTRPFLLCKQVQPTLYVDGFSNRSYFNYRPLLF